MAKCQRCNGKGIMTVHNVGTDENFRTECDICHGTGEAQPIKNEEFLRSATTEQLAEWLKDTLARCYRCGGCDELAERNCTVKICYYADVVEWLKQPHTEKE